MHGNVWEWCADWYDEDYYYKSPGTDPKGSSGGTCRVLRGGSWLSEPNYLRSATRLRELPGFTSDGFGFRVARDP